MRVREGESKRRILPEWVRERERARLGDVTAWCIRKTIDTCRREPADVDTLLCRLDYLY